MKHWKHIASVFLAALLLLASSGYSMHRMVCLHSGKTQVSLFEFDCCPQPQAADEEQWNRHCCDRDAVNFSVDEFSSNKSEKAQVLITQAPMLLEWSPLFRAWESKRILHFSDTSPPFLPEALTILFQVFRC